MELREFKLWAAAMMTGGGRSRRRVAKKLEAFLSSSRGVMASLEKDIRAVLQRMGLSRRSDEWAVDHSDGCLPARRRHSG